MARAPRYHVPAEFGGNEVLSSSGMLVAEIGGPSVKRAPRDEKSLKTAFRSREVRYIGGECTSSLN